MMKKVIYLIIVLSLPNLCFANGLEKITSDPITSLFLVAITITGVWFQLRFDRYTVAHGPEILTTLGIFGCFFGIALALLDFDTQNITDSVPRLLNGVKTAFWASVAGVFWALSIKFRHRLSKQPLQVSETEPKAAGLEDVVGSLNLLRKSIAGENDSSLISQMKLMRQEQNDNASLMRKSLEDFAEKVSELGSKALIEALEKVIRDFNTQLNEQFGENFKQLNLAVEKLVQWQNQYKEELDHLQAVQKQSAEDLARITTMFSDVVSKADAYTESSEKLKLLLEAFESQYQTIKQSQESLIQILLDMKSVEPSFSQKLTDLTEVFRTGTNSVTQEIQSQVKEFSTQLREKNDELSNIIKKLVPEIQGKVNEQILDSQKQLAENFRELDQNLEKELQKSLTTLGQQLASLSEKFVKDYGPLTERLREIVNISKGL
jgi:hypothetical protein